MSLEDLCSERFFWLMRQINYIAFHFSYGLIVRTRRTTGWRRYWWYLAGDMEIYCELYCVTLLLNFHQQQKNL